ncbi:ketopantoate reductase PanE/ApbA-domain-containing protein [Aspergillus pseudodeflectus]|uniref:Ketopantoate reductase PanE/ApbA-domain-containing protein n=1 Tax=Aspergillus pseudodeflectus TaxID=176178 RepID=A0ABR4J7X4_9EURO
MGIKHFCLVGSGGVGTIASLVLTKSALARVTVVLRSKYNYVLEHGWEIDSVDHGKISRWKPYRVVRSAVEAATVKEVEYDYVVVATKALPSLNPVVKMISPVITPGKTTVVLIQNGIGIEQDIVKAYPGNVVMSSVSHIGSEVQEPNVVVQVGKDVSKTGPHLHGGVDDSRSMAKARSFVEMYIAGGAHTCELVSDIQTARWEKLLWNGAFNTVCALMRMDVGELQRSNGRETLLVPMIIVQWMAYRLPDDCAYRPSMLLDLENGRPMEVDVILGNALAKAREVGVETPVLSVVYNLLVLEEWKIGQRTAGKT